MAAVPPARPGAGDTTTFIGHPPSESHVSIIFAPWGVIDLVFYCQVLVTFKIAHSASVYAFIYANLHKRIPIITK